MPVNSWGTHYSPSALPQHLVPTNIQSLKKREDMEGLHQLALHQQRLVTLVTNAVCRSETRPETTEKSGEAIEN